MNARRSIVAVIAVLGVALSLSSQSAWWPFGKDKESAVPEEELTVVTWEDLIPDDFVQPENPFANMSQERIDKLMDGSDESNAEIERLQKDYAYAPVVDEIDGKRVKLAAYVTPLDFTGQQTIKEFLLVPYVGACVHVPPPPANQVVHAESVEAVPLPGIYEAVWAVGTIRTETVQSDLAESGYRFELDELLPYSPIESEQ